jgi:haloalkane dehalogenase
MSKLLLTSVIRPFGGPGEGDSVGAELFHAQITRAQGPFSPRQTIRVWALDYLAENIQAPTVTLHYPSRREFVRELRRGEYTHVGINFVVATFHKVREMVALVRRHLPSAKVILGGYGTVLPDSLLGPHSDAICREEGVGFLRRLLGEPEGPIRTPHAPIPGIAVLSHQQPNVIGHVTAGLGCPNGCDFCCTSHFYKRRYQRFLESGRDIYEALLATQQRARADGMKMNSFIVIDEDFFINHRRAREFLDCVREGGTALSMMGFGSVRGLSRFTAREIAEMGFDTIWTAFEGKHAGYSKQRGRPLAELYADLKSVGCAQLTSMIIGFPYQDEATIRAEFEEVMALDPALLQCLIYFAFPGTPFHEQAISEGRYRSTYRSDADLRRWDGFAMHFDHPHFEDPERIEALQREIFRQDFERLGPSLLRLGRVWLTGYENLRGDPNPLLAARARLLARTVRPLVPLARATARHGPNPTVRGKAAALHRDLVRLTGAETWRERAEGETSSLLYLFTRATGSTGYLQQPGLLRTVHNLRGAGESQDTRRVMRLQGGRFAGLVGLGRVLLEDTGDNLRSLGGRLFPTLKRQPFAPGETSPVTTQPCPLQGSLVPAI